ncbi:MAG: EamA family transporter, partial [Alphaproteobacteria bacterium]
MSVESGLRLITLGAIWGSSFLFMKVAVPAFGPAALIEIRLLLAAILLAAVATVSRRPLNWQSNWRHHFVIG